MVAFNLFVIWLAAMGAFILICETCRAISNRKRSLGVIDDCVSEDTGKHVWDEVTILYGKGQRLT